MPNGRCWMHGGPSPGDPTGNKNALKQTQLPDDATDERTVQGIHLTINGIAAGLRNSG
jgi:Phosphoenolpyruvate carboxylase